MPLVTENFSDIITFTRNSTGTYFNSSGVLTSASTNVPRRDYNPITLEARGLLIEEVRTNLITSSAVLPAGVNVTITADTFVAPDGTTTGDQILDNATLGEHYSDSSFTPVAATNYTFSAFIKNIGASSSGFAVLRLAGDFGAFVIVNLSTFTVATTGGAQYVSSSVQAINNGWYRISLTGVSVGTVASVARVQVTDVANLAPYSGTGEGFAVWGRQLEAGAFPTSYIPTTTIALTREPDAASVNTMSPWYTQAVGTVYAEFMSMVSGSASQTNGSQGVWSTTQSALGSFNGYGVTANLTAANAASITFRSRYFPTGKNNFVSVGLTSGYLNGNIVYKVASTWNASQITAASNVRTAITTTNNAAADMGTHDQMLLGNQSTGGTPPYQLNGWLRHIKYYPQNFSNTDLQTITA